MKDRDNIQINETDSKLYQVSDLASFALRLGGESGVSELMLMMAMMKVIRVGTNQAMFIVGISVVHFTNVGVIPWPRTIPNEKTF